MPEQLDLISFAAASPAKTSRSPVAAPASRAASARGSGGNSAASSASCAPRSSSSKTSFSGGVAGCPSCGALCGGSAMPPCRFECRPLTLGPLTSGRASSFWPTPTASSYGSSNNGCPGDGREVYATRGKPSLEVMARSTWPTPVASDWKSGHDEGNDRARPLREAALWPTATARCGDPRRGPPSPELAEARYAQGRRNLDDAVALWPTATARDHRRSGSRNKPGSKARPGLSLTDATLRGGSSRQGQPESTRGMVLNPRFVERLMGFPDGWTAPDCRRWGMQLSLLPPLAPG